MPRKKSIIDEMETVEFSEIVKKSNSIKDILVHLGFKPSSGTMYGKIRSRIDRDGIECSHLERRSNNSYTRIPMSDILVENSTYTNRYRFKIRLVNEGILKYECDKCKNDGSDWFGEKLTLQLDHKNGIPNDNRVENLRFLCPNCHSQTGNFSGRNKN